MIPISFLTPVAIFLAMATVEANLAALSSSLQNYQNLRQRLSFLVGGADQPNHHQRLEVHHPRQHHHHHHNRHPLPPVALPLMFGGGSSTPQHHNDTYEEEGVDGGLAVDPLGDVLAKMNVRELECLVQMESDALPTASPTPSASVEVAGVEWPGGGDLDEETPSPCNRSWDKILCWPPTPGGSLAVLPCFDELNGIKYNTSQNATRFCHSNGTWAAYTDYNACSEVVVVPDSGGGQTFGVELATSLYIAGYALSLAALAVAIFIFTYFKDLRCLRNTIHTNLMCTYMLAGFMWILTLTLEIRTKTDTTSCIILVTVLHYFHLTNFFWMFVEGLYLYVLVVETFKTENIKLRVYIFIGWGIPVLVTGAWVIAKSIAPQNVGDTQLSSPLSNADTSLRLCPWMRPHTLDWIYQAPAIGLLFINSIFLVMIMWVLITKLRSATNAETQQYRKATKALLVLIPLLGITYVVVIAGPTHGLSGRVYACLCALLLSTQGFTVALFYCFLNSEVQNHVRHHIERWKTARSVGSRRTYSSSKDWSPKTRMESVRLFSHPNIAPGFIARSAFGCRTKKRDSHDSTGNGRPENSVCSTVSAITPMPPIASPPTQYLAPHDNVA